MYMNSLVRKNVRDLLQQLAPLGEVNGVRDYLFLDRQGTILARKPDSSWAEDVATACALDAAQVGEILGLMPFQNGDERVFDLHFKSALFVACDLGRAYLLTLCREDANLAVVRMTVNVIKEELGRDRRFRRYLEPPDGGDVLLSEQRVGSEMYKLVVSLKQK